jgi:hypothetical protein
VFAVRLKRHTYIRWMSQVSLGQHRQVFFHVTKEHLHGLRLANGMPIFYFLYALERPFSYGLCIHCVELLCIPRYLSG